MRLRSLLIGMTSLTVIWHKNGSEVRVITDYSKLQRKQIHFPHPPQPSRKSFNVFVECADLEISTDLGTDSPGRDSRVVPWTDDGPVVVHHVQFGTNNC